MCLCLQVRDCWLVQSLARKESVPSPLPGGAKPPGFWGRCSQVGWAARGHLTWEAHSYPQLTPLKSFPQHLPSGLEQRQARSQASHPTP